MSASKAPVRTLALGILAGTVASVGLLAVAGAGFTLSYDAIRGVGIASRVRQDWAWMLPVSVDGAMAVATVTVVVLRRLGVEGWRLWYPWLVVIAGATISTWCNAVHATGEPGAPLKLDWWVRSMVSAIPPLMVALSVHLLVTLVVAYVGSLRGSEDELAAARRVGAPGPVELAADTEAVIREANEAIIEALRDDDGPNPWQYSQPIGPTPESAPRRLASVGELGDARLRHDAEVLRNRYGERIPPRKEVMKLLGCGWKRADEAIAEHRQAVASAGMGARA